MRNFSNCSLRKSVGIFSLMILDNNERSELSLDIVSHDSMFHFLSSLSARISLSASSMGFDDSTPPEGTGHFSNLPLNISFVSLIFVFVNHLYYTTSLR